MRNLLQPSELPEPGLVELAPPPEAVEEMCYYIIGCQPRWLKQLRQVEGAAYPDPREPDNAYAQRWYVAIEHVYGHLRQIKIPFYDLLVPTIIAATADAHYLVDHLWDLPLKPPKHFNQLDVKEWQQVAHWYQPRTLNP